MRCLVYFNRHIAHVNLELARQVIGMGILDDPLRDRDLHAITSLRRLVETDDLALLTSQPWFTDGLSDEETAFLVVTNRDQHSDSQYRDFLRTHFTRSATISLPLAGDVVVIQPKSGGTNVPTLPEEPIL